MDFILAVLALVLVVSPFVSLGMSFAQRSELARLRGELAALRLRLDGRRDGPKHEPERPKSADDEPIGGAALRATTLDPSSIAAEQEAAVEGSGEQRPADEPSTESDGAAGSGAARSRSADGGLETFVGGRVLLVVGVVAVLLALAFFLKLAIDRGWIGPGLRVGLGVAAGVLALLGGDRLRGRGYTVYGHAIMGAGLGALFLCTFVSALRYGFIGRETAFVLCALVTLLGAALAVWRHAALLAWLGFLGGYAAPALLGQDVDALEALMGWLVLLDLGVAACLVFRPWLGLDAFAVVVTLVYWTAWRGRWYEPSELTRATVSLGVVQLCTFAVTLAPAWFGRRLASVAGMATLLLASLASLLLAHALLWPDGRYGLAGATALAGVITLLVARAQQSRHGVRAPDVDVLDAFTLASVVTAMGLALDGNDGLAPAWSSLGVVVVWLGVRYQRSVHQVGGVLAVFAGGLAALRLGLPLHAGAFTPILNATFAAAATPCVALVLCGRLLAGAEERKRAPASEVWPAGLLLRAAGLWSFAGLLAVEVHETIMLSGESSAALRAEALRGVTSALAVYAMSVAFIWGRQRPAPGLLPAGPLVGSVLAAVLVLSGRLEGDVTPVLNAGFGCGAVVMLACGVVAQRSPGPLRVGGWVTAGLLLLVFLSRDIHQWGETASPEDLAREQARFRAQLVMSSVWAVYGALMLVFGFVRRLPPVRWAGLSMLLVTVAKVFLIDLANLDTAYRMGSFLVLGVLLVATAFLYQRATRSS